MQYEQFRKEYIEMLEEIAPGIELWESDVLKAYAGHVVVSQYQYEEATKAMKRTKTTYKKREELRDDLKVLENWDGKKE